MTNEKKLWLCEQYAQKAWALSLSLAQEAARANQLGKGYAVIAREARGLCDKLLAYVAEAKFGNGGEKLLKEILDFTLTTGFLSVNATLEMLRVNPMLSDMSINKSMAVLVEELRMLSIEIGSELGALPGARVWQKSYILPEVISPLKSSGKTDFFFRFSIGGFPFAENTANVQEVRYHTLNVEGDTLNLRGLEMPVINCYRHFNLPRTEPGKFGDSMMIIQHDGTDKVYAVLIDCLDINAIFSSRIGCNVPYKADNVFSKYTRECWDVAGDDQLAFVDWEKLPGVDTVG